MTAPRAMIARTRLLGDFLRNQRDFEGARGTDDGDVAFAHAVANQGINCTADQAFNDEAVEAAHHQSVAAFGGDEGTFDGLQGHSSDLLKSRDASASLSDIEPRIKAGNNRSLFGGHVFYNFQIETGYRIKFHRAIRRILRTPRSRRICEPAPTML
jgi:hypothetical protein